MIIIFCLSCILELLTVGVCTYLISCGHIVCNRVAKFSHTFNFQNFLKLIIFIPSGNLKLWVRTPFVARCSMDRNYKELNPCCLIPYLLKLSKYTFYLLVDNMHCVDNWYHNRRCDVTTFINMVADLPAGNLWC